MTSIAGDVASARMEASTQESADSTAGETASTYRETSAASTSVQGKFTETATIASGDLLTTAADDVTTHSTTVTTIQIVGSTPGDFTLDGIPSGTAASTPPMNTTTTRLMMTTQASSNNASLYDTTMMVSIGETTTAPGTNHTATGTFVLQTASTTTTSPLQTSVAGGYVTTASPITTGSMPSTTGPMPFTTGTMSSTTGQMPFTTGTMSSTTGPMPFTTGTMSSTTGQMPYTTGMMSSTTGPVTSATGMMSSTTGQMPYTTGMMSSTTGPVTSATGMMSSTTGQMPFTTGMMSSTTGPVTSATGPTPTTGQVQTLQTMSSVAFQTRHQATVNATLTASAVTSPTTSSLPGPGSTAATILGLQSWLFGTLVGAGVLVLLLIIVVSCIVCRRRRKQRVKVSRETGWINREEENGVEVMMTNLVRRDRWQSVETIDENTTNYDGKEVINVFDAENPAFKSSPTITRLVKIQSESQIDVGETFSDKSDGSGSNVKVNTPKKAKTLTKVNTPIIGSVSQQGDQDSIQGQTASKAIDGSDTDSVFSSKADPAETAPSATMDSFKSPSHSTISPNHSPLHQKPNSNQNSGLPAPPGGSDSLSSQPQGAQLPAPPPPPPVTPTNTATDATGQAVPDLPGSDRQQSFLHTKESTGAPSTVPPPPPL